MALDEIGIEIQCSLLDDNPNERPAWIATATGHGFGAQVVEATAWRAIDEALTRLKGQLRTAGLA